MNTDLTPSIQWVWHSLKIVFFSVDVDEIFWFSEAVGFI